MNRIWLYLLGIIVAISCKGPESQVNTLYPTVVVDGDTLTQYAGELPNEVRTHILNEPGSLHPMNAAEASRDLILDLTHQRLNYLSLEDGSLMPQLADLPAVSSDGLSYTYTINEAATWPDGTPVTAADAMFSLKAMGCALTQNPALKSYLEYIQSAEIDPQNARRFTVRMNAPYLNNRYYGIYTYVLDRRRYDPGNALSAYSLEELKDETGEAVTDSAVIAWAERFNDDARNGHTIEHLQGGSGPYRIERWDATQGIRLVREENFWGNKLDSYLGAQYPEAINFAFVKGDQLLTTQLKQQQLDLSIYISNEAFDELKASPTAQEHFDLHMQTRSSVVLMAFNNQPTEPGRLPFFQSKEVRRAIALAIDFNSIRETILNGYGRAATSPVSPGNPFYHQTLEPMGYDPQMAQELLEQAGWVDADGNGIREKELNGKMVNFEFDFYFPPNSEAVVQMAERIQSDLRRIGIICNLLPTALGTYRPLVLSGQYDAGIFALSSAPLPYDFKQVFHSREWPEGFNFMGFANEEADDLIDRLRVSTDVEEQKRMAYRVQEILQEEQPAYFLYHPPVKIAVHKRFNNRAPLPISPHLMPNFLRMLPAGE